MFCPKSARGFTRRLRAKAAKFAKAAKGIEWEWGMLKPAHPCSLYALAVNTFVALGSATK